MNLPLAADDPRNIRCVSDAAGVDIVWTLDDEATPKLTAGWPTWDDTQCARRRSLLVFTGAPAWRMDIPILLDAWIARGARADFVARQYKAIQTLSTMPTPTTPPAACVLSGASLPRAGGNWELTSVDERTVRRDVDDGGLLRWQGTLSFAQIVVRDTIEIPGLTAAKGTTYRWQPGDTLQRVAARKLGSTKRWAEITWPNGTKIRPGDKRLKAGVVVRIPPR